MEGEEEVKDEMALNPAGLGQAEEQQESVMQVDCCAWSGKSERRKMEEKRSGGDEGSRALNLDAAASGRSCLSVDSSVTHFADSSRSSCSNANRLSISGREVMAA